MLWVALGIGYVRGMVRPHGGGDFHLLGREDVVVGFVVVIAIAHLVMMVTKQAFRIYAIGHYM